MVWQAAVQVESPTDVMKIEDPMKYLRALLFFFATLMIYLGIPLLGWGLGDLGGFFSINPRLGYAIIVGVFSLAVGIQAIGSTEGIRGGKGEKGKLVLRQSIVRVVLVLSLYLALSFIPFADRRGIGAFNAGGITRWLGVGLSGIGYALVFWSGLALGKQYSAEVTIQKDHQLITTSIYRYIRNPRYLGVIALSIGVSCVFRSWIGLIASVFFLGIILTRIKDEETILHKEFGQEWEDYCKRSWRLIPYLF
jgi:protein-S-isoprenylcysteine O-methyltransferase Ste14